MPFFFVNCFSLSFFLSFIKTELKDLETIVVFAVGARISFIGIKVIMIFTPCEPENRL